MSNLLGYTSLIALLFCGQVMAQGGTIHFRGAIVEPGCQAEVGSTHQAGSPLPLSECNRGVNLRLTGPLGTQASTHYRLTTGEDGAIHVIANEGVAADERLAMLVAEYL